MSYLNKAENRWSERRKTVGGAPGASQQMSHVQLSVQEAIAAPSNAIWQFIQSDDAPAITSEGTLAAVNLPGTPVDEVGQRVVQVQRMANGIIIGFVSELVEFQPGRRTVWRLLSAVEEHLTTTELLPVNNAVTVLRVSVSTCAKTAASKALIDEWQSMLKVYVQRVREVVETTIASDSGGQTLAKENNDS
ncbi:MAG: hypothetical protein ACYC3W_00445 [Candidatus Nanopelagicales bacterium]